MKKLLAIVLAAVLCFSFVTGCSNDEEKATEKPAAAEQKESLAEAQKKSDTLLSNEEIAYVMIYNPEVYDELVRYNELLNTGDISDYVEAVVHRADGLEPEVPEYFPYAVGDINGAIDVTGFDLEGGRAGAMIIPYEVGDTHDFYYGDNIQARKMATFECKYAGEYCNVWTLNDSITDAEAEDFGTEFDENIYEQTTEMFGLPRFADNGSKVNLMFYPMQSRGLMGFFWLGELFASDEVPPDQKESMGMNTDHNIVNLNSLASDYTTMMYATLAHEFQHLICATNMFETAKYVNMRTWLNEAMSGYIEEYLYKGSQDAANGFESLSESNRIRHGQSLYNFATTNTYSEFDIGVYDSVYLFSEYLANLAGKDIFSNVHDYWRSSYSLSLDEAEAIVNSVDTKVYDKIDSLVDYEGLVEFDDEDDEWLSKLALDFYLSLVKADKNDPKAFKSLEAEALLYDEINPADIEGGGRVIAALSDGEFKFPEDADEGLVYVGFNKDFEVVTEIVVR